MTRKALGSNVGRPPAHLPGMPKPQDTPAPVTAVRPVAVATPVANETPAAEAADENPPVAEAPPANSKTRSRNKKPQVPMWVAELQQLPRASGTGTVEDPRVRIDGVKTRSFTLHLPVDLIEELDNVRGRAPRGRLIEAMIRHSLGIGST